MVSTKVPHSLRYLNTSQLLVLSVHEASWVALLKVVYPWRKDLRLQLALGALLPVCCLRCDFAAWCSGLSLLVCHKATLLWWGWYPPEP